ncbi:MAG: GTPase Era, partial [Alphaproteobacteria bacterium]|nr:GTPase Era [Alphaproteobacteria bacterium]
VGQKISIVTPKAQTTRSKIRGIVVRDETEVILVDVPGIFKAKRKFEKAMVAAAWDEASEADIRLLLIDVTSPIDDEFLKIIDRLEQSRKPCALVLNKIDLIQKEKLLLIIDKLKEKTFFEETFLISAATGENTEELLKYIISRMPEAPFMYPEDSVSDLPLRLMAAEITREKLFMNLQQELPYSTAVETTLWEETETSVRIEQTVYIQREAQKAIVIGKKGQMLKKIGQASRYELSKMLEKEVSLFLFVKVRENWVNDPERYSEWGLDFNV